MDFAMINQATLTAAGDKAKQAASALKGQSDADKIREKAKEFEAVFISQMLSPMFEGIEVDDNFGGGHAEKMFRGMQVTEMAKAISEGGGIGIADAIVKEMLKMQEV